MRYNIQLYTDDPDIIEAFEKIGERSKAKFVEKALIFFLSTKKGKDTVEFMAKKKKNNPQKASKSKDTKKNLTKDDKTGEDTQPKIKGPISIDKFL